MILSILICSLFKRAGSLAVLLRNFHEQIQSLQAEDQVEILIEADDGQLPTGTKRNKLLNQAKGEWTAFIDDDDSVMPTYIADILQALESNPDTVGFNGYMTTNGSNRIPWKLAKDLPYETIREGKQDIQYLRHTNHLNPTRRSIALQIGYKDLYVREDYDYSCRLKESGLLQSEVYVDRELYHYNFKTTK